MDRLNYLMQRLIKGDKLNNWHSLNRLEEYLVACINRSGIENLGAPLNRYEELLEALYKALKGTETDTKIISKDGDIILFGDYNGKKLPIDNQGLISIRTLIQEARRIPLEFEVNVKPFYVESDTNGDIVLKSTATTKGISDDNEGNIKIL